jgi:sulfite reductase (NADPH) flavoprotein alpha-component
MRFFAPYSGALLTEPTGQPVTVADLLANAEHSRALNQLRLDPLTGQVRRHARYADKSLAAQLLASVYALHVGEYFGLLGRILMALASAALPLFLITGWLLYLDRRRKKRGLRAAKKTVTAPSEGGNWLIGFASQSGYAEQVDALHEAGRYRRDLD